MRLMRDRLLWTPTRKEPLAQGRRGPDMTRNSTSLLLLVAATLFLSSAFPSPAAAQTVSFVTRVDYAVGANPSSVAVGDFNGDGRPDLAVANYYSNDVSVLLGNGDGTFQPAQSFTTAGPNPVTVAMGDVNGDGRPDLAVTNSANTSSGAVSGNVSVLLGNGNGTFQPARNIAVGITPDSVVVSDFNCDGRPDLAVANFLSNIDSVPLGKG